MESTYPGAAPTATVGRLGAIGGDRRGSTHSPQPTEEEEGRTLIAVATATIAAIGLAAVALIALAAAIIDIGERRIPNRACLAALGILATTGVARVIAGEAARSIAVGVGWGIVLSGAPFLFAVWLVRPTAIGGGDWKLLAVLGATLGALVTPAAAAIAGFAAVTLHLAAAAATRNRVLPYGPSLFAGYIIGWTSLAWLGTGTAA
jgi:prepilin signal peptidase PulO-like enzyme (type II secretory pathway)